MPKSRPRYKDFSTFTEYARAYSKYCYDNNIGNRGPSFNSACWVIDWVQSGCVDSYTNLIDKSSGTIYIHETHLI